MKINLINLTIFFTLIIANFVRPLKSMTIMQSSTNIQELPNETLANIIKELIDDTLQSSKSIQEALINSATCLTNLNLINRRFNSIASDNRIITYILNKLGINKIEDLNNLLIEEVKSKSSSKILIKLLIKLGANINTIDQKRMSPLVIALKNNNIEIVRLLLQLRANPNPTSKEQKAALFEVLFLKEKSSLEIMKLLLTYGANPNIQDKKGKTTLTKAAFFGKKQHIELLLQYQADPDILDKKGKTTLMQAAYGGKLNLIKLLLRYQASIEFKDRKGHTALDYAKKSFKLPYLQKNFSQDYIFLKLFECARLNKKVNMEEISKEAQIYQESKTQERQRRFIELLSGKDIRD